MGHLPLPHISAALGRYDLLQIQSAKSLQEDAGRLHRRGIAKHIPFPYQYKKGLRNIPQAFHYFFCYPEGQKSHYLVTNTTIDTIVEMTPTMLEPALRKV